MEFIRDYTINGSDLNRPWGSFYYINNKDLERFKAHYFSDIEISQELNLSPKILIINPHKRLSWQYHNRRKEYWSILRGPVGIVRSNSDVENEMIQAETGDIVIINREERHRLVGLDNYAVVAELWCHTDISNPSDENDIVRVQDDFKR
jgi:mannose-6-phosphate isomerase-like protein (cupin superfamily)